MQRWALPVGDVGLEASEEGAGAENGHALVGAQALELGVAGHQVVGLRREGGGEYQVILGVSGHTVDRYRERDDSCFCRQRRERGGDLLGAEVAGEVAGREGPAQLVQHVLGDHEFKLAGLLCPNELAGRAGGITDAAEAGSEDVGVQNGRDHR